LARPAAAPTQCADPTVPTADRPGPPWAGGQGPLTLPAVPQFIRFFRYVGNVLPIQDACLMSRCGGGHPPTSGRGGAAMGRDVPAIVVSYADRRRYREKVRRCLDVFARMLRESRFIDGTQVGLEVEFNLVDEAGLPFMHNDEVLAAIADPN